MTSLISATERVKTHMVRDRMSVDCSHLWDWKVRVLFTLGTVRFISRVCSARRRKSLLNASWSSRELSAPGLPVLFRPVNLSDCVMIMVKTVSQHKCALYSGESGQEGLWKTAMDTLKWCVQPVGVCAACVWAPWRCLRALWLCMYTLWLCMYIL